MWGPQGGDEDEPSERDGASPESNSQQHEGGGEEIKKERRTCLACMLAKVKCDRQTPACSRCVRLKLAECIEQPNRPGRPYKDPVKRQAANEGRLMNARKKPARPARRTDERSSLQSSAKQESAFNSGADSGYRGVHSNAAGYTNNADPYAGEAHLPVPPPATSVWERPNAVPVHLIRDFLLIKGRGKLDIERTTCVLRGMLMWNMILQRDTTRGLLEALVSHLGFTVHDLLLRPLVPGLPPLPGSEATREDTHCPIRSKPDPVLELCVRDHGGVLPAMLGALDDGISAFAYDTVLPNRPVQLGVNTCFLETFFSFDEYRRIIAEQGLVPLFIYASLVARADRAEFLSDLAEYLFSDSCTGGHKQMTGVYTFVDRRGASFTGACRLRSQCLEQGEYTAHAISIFPLPSPCKHLTAPGPSLDPASAMLRGIFDGAPLHPTQPVTVHLGHSSGGPPTSPRAAERKAEQSQAEGPGMEDGFQGALRQTVSSSTSSVSSSTGSGGGGERAHYARVAADKLQGHLPPPAPPSLFASRFGPRDGTTSSPFFGYSGASSGLGAASGLCGNTSAWSRPDLVDPPPPTPTLNLLEAVVQRDRERELELAIARGSSEAELRGGTGKGRAGEGVERERGKEAWMSAAPDMGPGAVAITSRGFTSVVSREQASLLLGREVGLGDGGVCGGPPGGYAQGGNAGMLGGEREGRRTERTERGVLPTRVEPHPTARGEHLRLF